MAQYFDIGKRLLNGAAPMGIDQEDLTIDKEAWKQQHIFEMLNKIRNIVKITPHGDEEKIKTLDERYAILCGLTSGYVCVKEVSGKYYYTYATLGGAYKYDGLPGELIVANPYIPLDGTFKRDEEIGFIPFNTMLQSVWDKLEKYASMITECEVSVIITEVWERLPAVLSSQDDNMTKSIENLFQDIIAGRIGSVTENFMLEGLRSTEIKKQSGHMTDLIEMYQYLKSSELMEWGINAPFNMKRESINSGETKLQDDMLLPIIDDMIQRIKEGCEKVTEIYPDLTFTVELSSCWADRHKFDEHADEVEEGGKDNEEELADRLEDIKPDNPELEE